MSAFNFFWNTVQSSEISDLQDRVEQLERDLAIAREWIEYLNNEIKWLNNEKQIR